MTKKKRKLIPTKSQWNDWTLPSKLSAVGAYIAIVSLAIFLIGKSFDAIPLIQAWLSDDPIMPESENKKDTPFFDFIVEKKCQDPSGLYCDELIYIINLGSEPRENVIVSKSPLPDNTQKRGLTSEQLRINKPRSKHISILGIGVDHKKLLYRESSYSGKTVRIIVLCRINQDKYKITYKGELGSLRLKKRTPVN